jgi:hypothetical protein
MLPGFFRHTPKTRRHHGSVRWTQRLLLSACALLILIPPAVAYAWSATNYADGAYFNALDYAVTCCYKVRQYNKVWRPVGNQFSLYEYDSNSVTIRSGTNTWLNPYQIGDSNGNEAKAECDNDEFRSVSPVTCQTTFP